MRPPSCTNGLAKDLALQLVDTSSAGQRVHLWLAKELLWHPKPVLLILDEMSENVDRPRDTVQFGGHAAAI
jgi:ATPase subunit of ABC transporter with duplicated ATPase domains